jgi:dinuclear metal center YbgI/SA1388 family protein
MYIHELYDLIDTVAPFRLQKEYDNAGLIVGSMDEEVHGVLLCLDVTHETVEEAGRVGANLILSHHPPIFRAIKRLDPVQHSALLAAIRLDMVLMAAHTNFDAAQDGLNAYVACQMGLTDVRILEVHESERWYKVVTFVPPEFREQLLEAMFAAGAGHVGSYSRTSFRAAGTGGFFPDPGTHPFFGEENAMASVDEDRVETVVSGRDLASVMSALRRAHPYEEPAVDVFEEHLPGKSLSGFGHVGRLPHVMDPEEFVTFIKTFFAIPVLPVAGSLPEAIDRVAFCSGSGSSLLSAAMKTGVQVLITGDVMYHEALEVSQGGGCIAIVDHYSSERFFAAAMDEALRRAAGDRELPPIYKSAVDYQPVRLW